MKLHQLVVMAIAIVCAGQGLAAEVSGTVKAVKGQRVTVENGGRAVTVSVPAGTVVKAGDVVTMTVQPVGDALVARAVAVRPAK